MRFASLVLHLLAATVWVGGLLFQAGILVPGLRGSEAGARHIARLSRRFHLVSGVALAVLIVTGVLNLTAGGLPPLGRLMEKLFLVFLLVLGTGFQGHVALPRLARATADDLAAAERRFAVSTTINAVLGLLVLLAALRLGRA